MDKNKDFDAQDIISEVNNEDAGQQEDEVQGAQEPVLTEDSTDTSAEESLPDGEGKTKPRLTKKKKILLALAAFFVIGTIVSGFFVLNLEQDDRKAKKLNAELAAMLKEETAPAQSQDPIDSAAPETSVQTGEQPDAAQGDEELPVFEKPHQNMVVEEDEPETLYLYRYHSLIERYEDFAGWITIGDDISLPVVQGDDNEFYLDHDIEGNENRNGAIFMDYENNPIDLRYNTYLYGHHYLGGKEMFAALEKYNDNTYALANSTFYFATVTDEYDATIFSKYRVYPDNWRMYAVDFEDDDDFAAWIDERIALSECDFGVEVTKDDVVLSLSTCDYSFDGAREIIHAVLKKRENTD